MEPALSEQDQKLFDEFHMWIGYCVAEWAIVEESLFRLCHDCLGKKEQAAIVYYRLPGIDARLVLVDELIRSVLPQKKRTVGGHDHADVKTWKRLYDSIKKLLSIRRQIAHFPVKSFYQAWGVYSAGFGLVMPGWISGDAVQRGVIARGNVVGRPSIIMQMAETEQFRKKLVRSPLKIDDLKQHSQQVKTVTRQLQDFCDIFTKNTNELPQS